MKHFTVPYGKKTLDFELPDSWDVTEITPRNVGAAPDQQAAVRRALSAPEGAVGLQQFRGAKSAAVAINDKTRPVPHAALLPPLLEAIEAIGIAPDHITLIIATGTHPPMPPDEFPVVVPKEILSRYPVICHDAYDSGQLVHLGTTSRGTEAWFNRRYVEADLRVVVGNIEPHQFMGFSGGVKSACIGLAGEVTVNHNHAMMTEPDARLGEYDHNPARQDVEELGTLLRVDFALNAILNDRKQIVRAVSGDPRAVMAAGIPIVRDLYQVPVHRTYDIVIASPGGYPKDINVYQAQKGFAHAALVASDGATVILAAACSEGTGSSTYEKWVQSKGSTAEVLEEFAAEGFHVGPHKAYQIARDASRVELFVISEMSFQFARSLLLQPVATVEEAISSARRPLPDNPQVAILPYANATIPRLETN